MPARWSRFAASLPVESAVLAGDIAQETLSENLVALAVKRFGRLDIAINNAGIAQSFVRLPQVPSDEARRIIDIDLMGVFYAMKHQLPQMERQYRQTRQGWRHRQHRLGRRAGRRAASFGLRRGQACASSA